MAYNGFDHEENNNEVKCPICGSRSVTAVGKKKGFGVGKALIGAALVGPIGLLGGAIGSQKVKVECQCLNCGHSWNPKSIWNANRY